MLNSIERESKPCGLSRMMPPAGLAGTKATMGDQSSLCLHETNWLFCFPDSPCVVNDKRRGDGVASDVRGD